MLVYKTTGSNETKFYGVTSNEFFGEDLFSDFEHADNAGVIDFEFPDQNNIEKLINFTVNNIATMKQAFEVYSIINNQSIKDTRRDFREEAEYYCEDDKPETFYRVATLDDFKEFMFDDVHYTYWASNSLLEWLESNVKDFEYKSIRGYNKGEECAFYKFNDNNETYLPLDEDTLRSVYGGAVDIEELEKDEQGYALTDRSGELLETVPELYIYGGDEANPFINDYMEGHYSAIPAEKEVIYF